METFDPTVWESYILGSHCCVLDLRTGDGSSMEHMEQGAHAESPTFPLIVIPFPKVTSMNPKDLLSPNFLPKRPPQRSVYLSFHTQNVNSSFPIPLHQSILTFSFKHLSHVLPQGCHLLGLLWMAQLHPGAGLCGQGDQELL